MMIRVATAAACAALILSACGDSDAGKKTDAAPAQTHVVFATDWRAQAEHGGFYQALAEGRYAARGLDVAIMQGGPAVNVPQLLAGGAADFGMGSNAFIPLNLVQEGTDITAVMAVFQKDPQVLIAHPRGDIRSIADMKGKPIMVSDATITTFWVWLRAKYGFEDAQIRAYTFNLAPFLVDPLAIQQGYATSEPYLIEKETGAAPLVFPLADAGYPGYANMVLVSRKRISEDPETVRAFVEASIEGWMSYLYGDPAPGNALIMADNPEMTDDMIAAAIQRMKAHGIVMSGDAETLGLGAMTEARWREFFETMAGEGVYPADLDWRAAFDTRFVNKGHARGMRGGE